MKRCAWRIANAMFRILRREWRQRRDRGVKPPAPVSAFILDCDRLLRQSILFFILDYEDLQRCQADNDVSVKGRCSQGGSYKTTETHSICWGENESNEVSKMRGSSPSMEDKIGRKPLQGMEREVILWLKESSKKGIEPIVVWMIESGNNARRRIFEVNELL